MCSNLQGDTNLGNLVDDKDTYIRNFILNIYNAKSYALFVEICGNKFICRSIIVTAISDSDIEFGKIIKIYSIFEEVYFLLIEVINLCFDYKYHAYKVIVHNEPYEIINRKMLPNVGPCLICRIKADDYIVTRYDV